MMQPAEPRCGQVYTPPYSGLRAGLPLDSLPRRASLTHHVTYSMIINTFDGISRWAGLYFLYEYVEGIPNSLIPESLSLRPSFSKLLKKKSFPFHQITYAIADSSISNFSPNFNTAMVVMII